MATRIGINGFGRIGRLALRAINQYHSGRLEVAAINGLPKKYVVVIKSKIPTDNNVKI